MKGVSIHQSVDGYAKQHIWFQSDPDSNTSYQFYGFINRFACYFVDVLCDSASFLELHIHF